MGWPPSGAPVASTSTTTKPGVGSLTIGRDPRPRTESGGSDPDRDRRSVVSGPRVSRRRRGARRDRDRPLRGRARDDGQDCPGSGCERPPASRSAGATRPELGQLPRLADAETPSTAPTTRTTTRSARRRPRLATVTTYVVVPTTRVAVGIAAETVSRRSAAGRQRWRPRTSSCTKPGRQTCVTPAQSHRPRCLPRRTCRARPQSQASCAGRVAGAPSSGARRRRSIIRVYERVSEAASPRREPGRSRARQLVATSGRVRRARRRHASRGGRLVDAEFVCPTRTGRSV